MSRPFRYCRETGWGPDARDHFDDAFTESGAPEELREEAWASFLEQLKADFPKLNILINETSGPL